MQRLNSADFVELNVVCTVQKRLKKNNILTVDFDIIICHTFPTTNGSVKSKLLLAHVVGTDW